MARMGGQMAEQKKRARAGTAGKKAVAKPEGTAVKQQRKPAVKRAKKATGEQVVAGFEMLRSAALNELSQNGERIAQKLREKSELGDTKSTKLLIELATKMKIPKPVTNLESVALKIEADPEWSGSSDPQGEVKPESEESGSNQ
jgi:hypothetical protein